MPTLDATRSWPSRRFLLAAALAAALTVAGAAAADKAATPPRIAPDVALTGGIDNPKGAGVVSSGATLPPIPPVTGSRREPVASWGKPLPWPIVIADRRNNRLIEIAPDTRIVWEFPTPNLTIYSGNEDVNFSPDGRRLAVSEEDNFDVHIVDYEKREITWTYGTPEKGGTGPGQFNYPDDAHLLEDGTFLTADIRNCRVVIIDPATQRIVTQWGTTGRAHCYHKPPEALGSPNGATPMDNGDILVSEIRGAWITRMTRAGKVVWSMRAPRISYPSDAFPTADGRQVIVADFVKPGGVVIFDPATRKVTWEYRVASGEGMLDHPSLARELPGTGDVVIADDLRHRVIVVDRATKKIVWQYGVTDTPGHAPGYLYYPDGFDLDVFRDWRAPVRDQIQIRPRL
ncbi:MAG TPA: PQQ-binding-like beta-propeller repeat protein [Casimicrobiaceae bacterium]|nr:PQQ-binding-like beta-propeller repeat protein [Casimicrobiaceae bacterium]